ncbi:helix-turn-helix domain-containing protein [Lachnospiraceae bacterium MD329]|nr:helix-turn-helix domain-containing protein [Lachnospiraceae bacterium MD329]
MKVRCKHQMKIMYQTGFTQIPNKIIRSRTLTTMQKIVLMVLCSYANDTNIAYPSYKTIATDSGISRRKAIDVINELIELGCIRKMERKTSKGDNTANDYEVLIGNVDFSIPNEENTDPSAQHSPPSAYSAPPPSEYPAPPSAHGAPEQYINNNIKYINNIKSINQDECTSEKWIDRYNKTVAQIKEQIDYDYLINATERDIVDEIVNIMAEVMAVYRPKYKIEGEIIDFEAVVNNFQKITADKLEVCLTEYTRRTQKIGNTKAYWITVLYNIPLTSQLTLRNIVNNDMYEAGG